MQHNGGLLAAVLVDVGQVELRRQAEVQLAGGQGVLCTDSGLNVDVQLRAIESSFADLLGEGRLVPVKDFYLGPGRWICGRERSWLCDHSCKRI